MSQETAERLETQVQQLILGLLRLAFRLGGSIAPTWTAQLAFQLFRTPRSKPKLRPRDQQCLDRSDPFTIPFKTGHLSAFRWRPEGVTGDRPRVLLVHGWESRAARLGVWVDPLLARGFEVIAFDGPAHGDSAGRRASLPEFVEAISSVAVATGPFHAIVGHSLGAGASAIAVAGEHLTSLPPVAAKRLVLVAGPDRAIDFFRQFTRLMGLSERVFAGFLAQIEALGGQPVEAYSTAAVLSGSTIPTLLLHDRDDEMIPYAAAEAIAAAAETATLRLSEGLGHHRIARAPEIIEPAIEFIRQGVQGTSVGRAVA